MVAVGPDGAFSTNTLGLARSPFPVSRFPARVARRAVYGITTGGWQLRDPAAGSREP
ncbi:hypothetical protein ABZ814_21950 [Micromonospora musae]|uniref:hypothetical protein n=1 Tax=Micromonospora musae TaxID=1894970 RepID=UPI0033E800EC